MNLKLGGGERPGKGSGKSSRPSTDNGRNAGAVRMECSLCTLHPADSVIQCSSHVTEKANPREGP